MPKKLAARIGDERAGQLAEAIRQFQQIPQPGSRDLPELHGVHAPPKQLCSLDQDSVILAAIVLLIKSEKVYAYGSDVVIEIESLDGKGLTLVRLRTGHKVEPGAEDILANVFLCRDDDAVFRPPRWFVGLLLRSDLLHGRLPRINTYAQRPLFDEDFNFCGPGWHPKSGVLIHGVTVEPRASKAVDPALPALHRLPPHLRMLFSGFCFKSNVDVANALSMLVTGVLANRFVIQPKGFFLMDGNQPGVGKTLLMRCFGLVLDGTDPRILIYLSNEEELQKQLGAQLRDGSHPQSLVFIDNSKTGAGSTINSQVLEAYSVAPTISIRILGQSANITRPNDLLWVLTMNDTRVSSDLVSRGVPIQFLYEGIIEERKHLGPDPLEYARQHRLEILGELAGLVIAWNLAFRPKGLRQHRSEFWGGVLGGILLVAGFPEFLTNYGAAASAFNSELELLAALAENVVRRGGPFFVSPLSPE